MDRRIRILLVDDNPQDRGLVARELRKEFRELQLLEAVDQSQLDKLLADGQFDLVITDYALQWSDGLSVLKSVRANKPHCPVIMFTATGSEEIAVEAMKNGLNDYIIKNVNHLVRLRAAVTTVLEHFETARRAQRLESRLADLTKHMKVGVFRADADGKLLETNESFRQILGCPLDEDMGRYRLRDFFLDERDFERCWNRLQVPGQLDDCEARLRRTDGRIIWASNRLMAVKEHDGVTVIDAFLDDISERKEAEAALRRNEAELAHAARLMTMGEMVAGIAHEINQPLGAISNYCTGTIKLLESADFPAADSIREAMQQIAQQSQRGAQIIRRLRDFIGRRDTERGKVKVGALLRDSTELVGMMVREARVTIEMELPQQDPTVVVDRVQVQQVLVNLLRNACEAMEQHKPAKRIVTISARVNPEHVEISVADRGAGLPEEGVDELFQPFVTNKPDGMGMGLAISGRIVRQHGGRFWATSNQWKGATFHFTLPVAREDESES